MPSFLGVLAFAFVSLCCVPIVAVATEDVPSPEVAVKPSIAELIQGEWVVYRDTPNGRYMTIKQHLGDHSVVTIYDPGNTPIRSHRSEYRVDTSGSVPIFRYRNKVVLVGPNAGAKEERESAYIFRVDGDRFFEVHGMLPGDKGEPSLITWERLKNNPIPKPKA